MFSYLRPILLLNLSLLMILVVAFFFLGIAGLNIGLGQDNWPLAIAVAAICCVLVFGPAYLIARWRGRAKWLILIALLVAAPVLISTGTVAGRFAGVISGALVVAVVAIALLGRAAGQVRRANADAGVSVPRMLARMVMSSAAALAVTLGLGWLATTNFELHYAASDVMEPDLMRGQQFIALNCCFRVAEGDIVVFGSPGLPFVRKIAAFEGDTGVVVTDGAGATRRIERGDIIGKVVHRF